MSIRYKLLFFFLVQHFVFLFIALLLSEFIIRPYNLEIEQKNAHEKISQIKYVLHSEMEHLSLLNIDWAVWDDTYEFMQDRDKHFLQSNFSENILETTHLNRIEIFDINGNSIYKKDDGKIKLERLFYQDRLKKEFYIWKSYQRDKGRYGIMKAEDTFTFVSLYPILKGDGKGPERGTVLMVRALNKDMIAKINKSTSSMIKLIGIDDPLSIASSDETEFSISEVNNEELQVIGYLQGPDSKVSVMIETRLIREFVMESEKLIFYLFMFGGGLGFLSFVISFYLLRVEVVKPLNLLIEHIIKIREDDNFIPSNMEKREDEIGVLSTEFNNLILKIDEKNKTLAKVARIDALTGLANRMDLDERFESESKQSCRDKLDMSILMIDIDYFKKYNDTYGHVKGDEVLAQVAKAVQGSSLRPRDYIARYGGEEFIIILPKTHVDGSVIVAQRVLKTVEDLQIEHKTSLLEKKVISVSVGCLTLVPHKSESQDFIINLADEALYTAKEQGRDRYHVYQRSNA